MTHTVSYSDKGQQCEIICDNLDQATQLASRLAVIENKDYVAVIDDDDEDDLYCGYLSDRSSAKII